MILVTGAAGKTGLAVLHELSELEEPVRAVARRDIYEEAVRAAGADSTCIGDLRDQRLVRTALEGVRSIYHIPPNVHPDELEMGRLLIDEARDRGVEHFVYHSVLHPHVEAMPHHWQKMRVEEYLFMSDLDFTILQPAAYMQNIFNQWRLIETEGRFQVPYPLETRLSLVDLHDVASAARAVLGEAGHRGAIYELVGTKPLSTLEVAALISNLLGREVRADTISIEAWRQNAGDAGLSTYAIETLTKMFEYYASYGFEGNPSVLSWLLGRQPTSYRQAIKRDQKL
ncbi:MAG: NmrA family NAD(P)-binding protein [Anaerolineales bacterium]|jgi:uncharacterized protein YbjT (DUF2867 family)